MNTIKLLDCTLRDGGYYNAWDFEPELITAYLKAVAALPVDMVEIGFRSMPGNSGKFKGGCAYCTDAFIRSMEIPKGLRIAVMVNGADLTNYPDGIVPAVDWLFGPADTSPVELVRIAVHVHKVEETLPAITRLNELGYKTTFQLMQIAGLTSDEVQLLAKACSEFPLDVLYFADSLGSMVPDDINQTVEALQNHWQGELGFHAHNNMQGGVANCIRAVEQGVTWIDGTVLGMGRGPGNAPTEYLAIEMETRWDKKMHHTPLLDLINRYFKPMQQKYGWGPNPYYYMAGKYGIHPTYVQTMLDDTRYQTEDMLAVINHLKTIGGKHYNLTNLDAARFFYSGPAKGKWNPEELVKDKTVLILGTGPGAKKYRQALENYIKSYSPVVIALNKQTPVDQSLIDVHAACHPIRLVADHADHLRLPQPLIIPYSMLPTDVSSLFEGKKVFDYGLQIQKDVFEFHANYAVIPNALVVTYVLALIVGGGAKEIFLAGFDGYHSDDHRTIEMNRMFKLFFEKTMKSIPLFSITKTKYKIPEKSIFEIISLI
jgi:4-hydroxy 2-oxovalerate aldolase